MGKKRVVGGCLCGAVRFELEMPSRFCAHCHCQNCRRAHGAAFVTYAGFRDEQVRLTRGEEILVRYQTATGATRTFCPTCGSTLFYTGPRWPGEVHVALAHVEDAIDRQPSAHVYADHGAEWFEITDDLPRYGGASGTEPKQDA